MHDYVRDGAEIYRQSFATIRAEADLSRFAPDVAQVVVRMIHAVGEIDLTETICRLQASRFSSDASHELRTPLTIVRGHLNQALHLAHDGSALQIKLAVVIQEVERVISISDKLLQLALADSGRMQLHYSQVNLSDLLGELVEDTKTGSSQLRVHADLKSKVLMQCDPPLIWQLLTNLMGNAIKFNRPQGWIELSLRQTGDQVFLTFANSSGQDTSKMDHRVFERFFRYSHFESTAANQTIEGFGLGLSLCREIVLAHQGDIQWEPRPNQSVLISVVLPVRPR